MALQATNIAIIINPSANPKTVLAIVKYLERLLWSNAYATTAQVQNIKMAIISKELQKETVEGMVVE